MAFLQKLSAPRLGGLLRSAAVALIAGICRWRDIRDIDADLRARSPQAQAAITGGVLGGLFALSLAAATFGWIGILVFWLAVVVVVN